MEVGVAGSICGRDCCVCAVRGIKRTPGLVPGVGCGGEGMCGVLFEEVLFGDGFVVGNNGKLGGGNLPGGQN